MEILFKGQRLSDCKWLYGNVQVPKPPFEKWFMWDNKLKTQVDGKTICQFTGLYDATKWQDLTEEQRDKWTLDGNMPSEWKGYRLFSDDLISDGDKMIRIYMTEGGFAIKWHYWAADTNELCFGDELILQALPDAQTRSYIENSCKLVGNIHDKK